MNCKLGESQDLVFDIPDQLKQEVKNCYYMKNKFFFYFCEKYCEHFHLVSPSDLFDGSLGQFKQVIEYMIPRLEKAFEFPTNNILTDGIQYETSVLKMNWKVVFKQTVFFNPTQQQHLLDE
jgi:hypothetical protein